MLCYLNNKNYYLNNYTKYPLIHMVFQLIGQWSLIVEATKTNKVRWRGKVVQEGKDRQGIPIFNDCFSRRVEHRTTAFLML